MWRTQRKGTARIVRAEVLRIKAQEYVLAAKAKGTEDQGAVAGKDLIEGLALYFQD